MATPATPPTPPTGTTEADKSAKATVTNTLNTYGLGSLAGWAWNKYLTGEPVDQIMLDLRQRPEYKARFPAMDALAKQGHAMSESEYINYENTAKQAFHAAGLPPGLYDQPSDFTKYLVGNVGLPELTDRVNQAALAASSAPAETRAELARLYGVTQGQLTAYFLDPARAMPVIQQQWQTAGIAGASDRSGYGHLSRTEAERLAAQGISADQAQQGFGTLAQSQELFTAMPGERMGGFSRDRQLGAVFGDAGDEQALQKRQSRRKAAFADTSSVAVGQQGAIGLGTASR